MELFSDEIINITGIASVYKNETDESELQSNPVVRYATNSNYCQLIFFLKGECVTVFNRVTIQDCEGSLRYLPAVSGGDYVVTRKKPDCCIDIVFTCDGLPQTASGYTNMQRLKDKFIKIYNLWSAKKPGYYARSMAVLYEIIDEFKNSREKYISKGQRDALDAAYAYILENYRKRDFDYNALCSASGFSYSHFKELFIKHFRLSPVKYVTKMRISYACDLLVSGMYSVTEISSMCGFDNVYYFSRVFKNEMGVTPGKYGCEV